MNDFQKLLPPPKETKIQKFRKSNLKWWKIYAILTVSAVLAFSVSLFAAYKGDFSVSEKLASKVIDSEFADLSGKAPPYNKDETKDNPTDIFSVISGVLLPPKNSDSKEPPQNPDTEESGNSIYDFDFSKVPQGEKAIIPMDLSLSSYGINYINNLTGYTPDLQKLLESDLNELAYTPNLYFGKFRPKVLILHTHGSESYSKKDAISYVDEGEIARSEDTAQNVVAVGEVLASALNKSGIPTVHCPIMHDKPQYKDSYYRAAQTVKQYLDKYPSITLVIDLHRDAIIKSSGELVKPVTSVNSKKVAQVMCVVGSDYGGESCKNWQGNLALAQKLRYALNKKYNNICRPTSLRSSTYNQEFSKYSLLLEIGSCGNSIDEAKRAAELVAEELIPLVKQM